MLKPVFSISALGAFRALACAMSAMATCHCCLAASGQAPGSASGPISPPYTPMVWDMDWSYLSEPAAPRDWTDRLHYLPLGHSSVDYLSLSGQIRERGEYQDYPAFGAQPPDNGYFLQRYLFGGDLHLGSAFRSFVQLDSGLIDNRDGGPRPGIDEDRIDLNQGFVDLTAWHTDRSSLTLRSGRQLVSLGSTRLVAIGAGLNVEQPFDGFRLTLHRQSWSAEGLALRPTLIRAGRFDNAPNSAEELWGLYLSTSNQPVLRSNFDLYYLGFDHRQARYTQGVAREQRETVGGRVWSHTPTWDYDLEYTAQFGRFGPDKIRAWGAGYHVGYTFVRAGFAPRPELDGGFLSGDRNVHDHTLGTFNPLFPNGNYLGESILLGPLNLVITRPTMKLSLSPKVASNTNAEFLWRESTQDGAYNIAGILTHPANGSTARFIGSQIQEELDYSIDRHWSAKLTYEHFFAGKFLKESPPSHSLNFIAPQLTWNF